MLAPYLGQYAFLEPVIIASLVVFVVDLIGNIISFSSRFVNALVTAIIFGLVFGALTVYGYGGIKMDLPSAEAIGKAMTAQPPAPSP